MQLEGPCQRGFTSQSPRSLDSSSSSPPQPALLSPRPGAPLSEGGYCFLPNPWHCSGLCLQLASAQPLIWPSCPVTVTSARPTMRLPSTCTNYGGGSQDPLYWEAMAQRKTLANRELPSHHVLLWQRERVLASSSPLRTVILSPNISHWGSELQHVDLEDTDM